MRLWRNSLDRVVNTINFHHEKTFKSLRSVVLSYFTQPAPVLPQNQPQFYKFKIGETVRIDASPRERKSLNFKYSLNRGNKTLMGLKNFYLFME